jgi:hypothetical protein
MAETYTNEGLDFILGVFPLDDTAKPTNLYLGLFTSQTSSTVPATTATGGAVPSGWTEATGTGYARQTIANTAWGAAAASGGVGRQTTGPQVTFTVGAGGWGTVNGFFIATQSASGASDKIILFANFDDLTAIATAVNDVIKITPTLITTY